MRRRRICGRPVSFVGFLLILALLAVNACDTGGPATDSTTGPGAGPASSAPEVGVSGGVTMPPSASPSSSAGAISTVSIDGPVQPDSGGPDALLSLAWTPSPHGSAVLGVSADGRTIGIAETPERTGIGNLHLFDDHGTPLLVRPFAVSLPHDTPFIALSDLAVVSQDTLFLLLQYKWVDFRVHRLTPNDTGMGASGVHLPDSKAYALALAADNDAELWAYDPDGDRSYPVFTADATGLDDRQQRAGARDGFPVGDAWTAVRLEAASVELEAVGREPADAWAGWHVRLVTPDGYEVISAAPLTLADNGLLYLLVRIHSIERTFEDDLVTILALDSAGVKRGQLTLRDDSLRQAARFDMTRDGTLYGLWSTAGILEVRTYTVPVALSGPDGSGNAATPSIPSGSTD